MRLVLETKTLNAAISIQKSVTVFKDFVDGVIYLKHE